MGTTAPNSPVTLEPREPRRLSSAASGGPPLKRTPEAFLCLSYLQPTPKVQAPAGLLHPPTDGGSPLQRGGPLPAITQAPVGPETAQLLLTHVSGSTAFRLTWSPTGAPVCFAVFWREFCWLLGATVSLSSGYHPQSNGQMEQKNQMMDHCVTSQHPAFRSERLLWVE